MMLVCNGNNNKQKYNEINYYDKNLTKSNIAAGISIKGLKFWLPCVRAFPPVFLVLKYIILNVIKHKISPKNIMVACKNK